MVWQLLRVSSPSEASGHVQAPSVPMGGCTRSCPLLPDSHRQQYSILQD